MPKQYPQEFRDDVIRVALNRDDGVTVAEVAHDFGIASGTLERWLTRYRVESGEKPGRTQAESAEMRALSRRNRLLEQENEVSSVGFRRG